MKAFLTKRKVGFAFEELHLQLTNGPYYSILMHTKYDDMFGIFDKLETTKK